MGKDHKEKGERMIIESANQGILQLPSDVNSFSVLKDFVDGWDKVAKKGIKQWQVVFFLPAGKMTWNYADEAERDTIYENIKKALKPVNVDGK
jgi:hypothetical protein